MTRARHKLPIGIVGFGKIARDRHLAAIQQSRQFYLHSIADTAKLAVSVPQYSDIETLLAADDVPDAVAVCTPPQVRYDIARYALANGKHVLLEKPPCANLGEIGHLRALAEDSGRTLFCAWHSRFAPAVQPAREWLSSRALRRVRIDWREDVRVWHPGQAWIWEPGGFGVFDPGINALSIATKILPKPFFLRDALLRFPGNCDTPMSAELSFSDADNIDITASFDFLQTGPQTWEIEVEADDGHLLVSEGGDRLMLDGAEVTLSPEAEYDALYTRFAELVEAARSEVDVVPMQLVADAFLHGRREEAPAFLDRPASTTTRSA
jgi:D-galactose 1-dehydrogenase